MYNEVTINMTTDSQNGGLVSVKRETFGACSACGKPRETRHRRCRKCHAAEMRAHRRRRAELLDRLLGRASAVCVGSARRARVQTRELEAVIATMEAAS